MSGIQYLVLRFGLLIFFGVVTSPVVYISIACMEYLDAHEQIRKLRFAFIPIGLVWLFGVPWLTSRTAQHMAFEYQTFAVALRMTYYDLRLRLAFLPLVGHWFERHTDKNDSDDKDT